MISDMLARNWLFGEHVYLKLLRSPCDHQAMITVMEKKSGFGVTQTGHEVVPLSASRSSLSPLQVGRLSLSFLQPALDSVFPFNQLLADRSRIT